MKLLIVEDEPKVVDFLKKGLEEQGYEIDVAYDGQMGEKLALRNTYDVIIIDVVLPFINGYELCRRIR
jgi:two-component system copper resistance phosphate regulon response regulator CusR